MAEQGNTPYEELISYGELNELAHSRFKEKTEGLRTRFMVGKLELLASALKEMYEDGRNSFAKCKPEDVIRLAACSKDNSLAVSDYSKQFGIDTTKWQSYGNANSDPAWWKLQWIDVESFAEFVFDKGMIDKSKERV